LSAGGESHPIDAAVRVEIEHRLRAIEVVPEADFTVLDDVLRQTVMDGQGLHRSMD
jgi:hypothetical protein